MKLLVIGGTQYVGRSIVEAALAGGHDVTLFNRGLSNPGLFPGVERLAGDRQLEEGLALLRGRQWDAAIDTIEGGVPDEIRVDYLDCYDGDRFVESMRYVRRYPEELPQLAELLPEIATPVTIINGRNDRVVPLANAEFLDERLPVIGNGAAEIRNWLAAHGAAGKRGFELIGYCNCPEVYVGCGFASWNVGSPAS